MIKLPPPINIDSELRLLLSCLYLSVNKLAFLNGPTWQKSQILTSLTNGYYDIFRNDEIDDDQKGGSKQTVNLKDFDAYFETIALNNPNYSLNSWITPPDFPTHSIRGCSNKYVDFTSRRSSLISESVFAKKQGSCRTCSQDEQATSKSEAPMQ